MNRFFAFLQGMAGILDFGNTLSVYSVLSAQEADNAACWSDWMAVGEDMKVALKKADDDMGRR